MFRDLIVDLTNNFGKKAIIAKIVNFHVNFCSLACAIHRQLALNSLAVDAALDQFRQGGLNARALARRGHHRQSAVHSLDPVTHAHQAEG